MMISSETVVAPVHGQGPAAEEEEYFDILDEDGRDLGRTELRSIVHKTGLYHRAVYCFLMDSQRRLLLQKRSMEKKVGPGQWDLSVAEHLQPGESYAAAAVRGLQEELGVSMPAAPAAPAEAHEAPASSHGHAASTSSWQLEGPLSATHRRQLRIPEKGILDFEFVESFKLEGYEGPIHFNAKEVTEVRWVGLDELQQQMRESPEAFTQWFRDELQIALPSL